LKQDIEIGISVKYTFKDGLVYIGFMLYNGMSDTLCPHPRAEPFSLSAVWSTHGPGLVTTLCFASLTYFRRHRDTGFETNIEKIRKT